MDTVAVYLEKPVRTYGLAARAGLELLELACPPERLSDLARELDQVSPRLRTVGCGAHASPHGLGWCVCVPAEQAGQVEVLARRVGGRVASRWAVCLIALQGPHFGDRWGIAHEALAGLAREGVRPRLVWGVTHTLQLLVDPADAPRALMGLRTRFSTPETKHA